MVNNILKVNKKNIILWMFITLILEIVFVANIYNTESTIMKFGGIAIVPIFTLVLVFMLTNLENAFYAFAFGIPLLPIGGYVFLRIGLINYQWIVYIVFYVVFLISMIINHGFKVIKFKFKYSKPNIILMILCILILVNSVFAYNKKMSLLIVIFGFIPAILFFLMADSFKSTKFFKNIILFTCIGVIISGLADLFTYLYLCSIGMRIYRLYGPLGSNFLLGYLLLVYPLVIVSYKIETGLHKKIYLILTILGSTIMATQYSRGILVALGVLFVVLFINFKNLKYYLAIAVVVMGLIGLNVSIRPEIKAYTDKNVKPNVLQATESESFLQFQSSNRMPIWNAAIKMAKDNPIIGVGLGNFQFFFIKYSGINRPYLDSHNFILNSLAEMGIVFTIFEAIYFIYMLVYSVKSIYKLKKEKNQYYLYFIATLSGLMGYFVFANITGTAFQCAREVHSYVPIFVLTFMIYVFNNYSSKSLENNVQ